MSKEPKIIEKEEPVAKINNILLPGILLGTIVVMAVLFFKVIAPSKQVSAQTKAFNLTLSKEQYQPAKIQVNLNDTVTLNVENKDNILHGLHLVQFNIAESIPPLSRKTIQFVATKNGSITAGCANDQHKEKLDVEVL